MSESFREMQSQGYDAVSYTHLDVYKRQAYALDIGRKIKAQARQAMKDGDYIGARAPYGYRKDPDNCLLYTSYLLFITYHFGHTKNCRLCDFNSSRQKTKMLLPMPGEKRKPDRYAAPQRLSLIHIWYFMNSLSSSKSSDLFFISKAFLFNKNLSIPYKNIPSI